jgi:hypothetical protein
MASHRLVVFTDAKPGREDEFNEWYDEVHLREVLEIDGFVAAQRFALSESQMPGLGDEAAPGRYLAIYEIEADDLATALEKLGASADRMQMSESFDAGAARAFAFTAHGSRREER